MDLTRRELLIRSGRLAGMAGAASLVGASTLARSATGLLNDLPPPEASGIDHVVVVMMENRSFDHYFGWLPGADGRQAGVTYVDRDGVTHSTYHLETFQGCGHVDPDHTWAGGRVEYADGRCDGWLKGSNDSYAIGYYEASDLAFLGRAAPYWTVCDHYFASIMAETYPNRFYLHAAQTDRLHNGDGQAISTLPTIWDRLAGAGLDGRYYYSDVPFTALWGSKYASISQPVSSFFDDCRSGNLPQVSFVDPRFRHHGAWTPGDDHPHADIRVGQHFMGSVYRTITSAPQWSNTLLIFTYDEWGGFFDHVPPPLARDANPACRLRGFRVPTMIVSPFARRRHVAHEVYDHTSILKLIEWRWELAPLTVRDTHARNLAEVLRFDHPDDSAPPFSAPRVLGQLCPSQVNDGYVSWETLSTQAVEAGFALPSPHPDHLLI